VLLPLCSPPAQMLAEEVPTLGGSTTSQVMVSEVQLPAPSVEILAPPLQQGSRSGNKGHSCGAGAWRRKQAARKRQQCKQTPMISLVCSPRVLSLLPSALCTSSS